MTALATTVGQIGADLNDELTIIFNAVDQARCGLPLDAPLRKDLSLISSAAQRCAWKVAELVKIGGPMRRQSCPAASTVMIPLGAGLFHPAVIESMLRRLQEPKERV